jgi:hypothetical protein
MKNVTGKIIRKLYVNQFVLSIFGVVITMAAAAVGDYLIVVASFLAIGLYLFVIYDAMWNEGAKTAAKRLRIEDVEIDRIKTPFLIILFASAFNILVGLSYLIIRIYVYTNNLFESSIAFWGNTLNFVMKITQGMYGGFDALLYPNPNVGVSAIEDWVEVAPMLTAPYYYLLTPIPLFIVGILAYYLGSSEMKLRNILGFNSDNN